MGEISRAPKCRQCSLPAPNPLLEDSSWPTPVTLWRPPVQKFCWGCDEDGEGCKAMTDGQLGERAMSVA